MAGKSTTPATTESKPTPPPTAAQGQGAPNVTEVKRSTLPTNWPTINADDMRRVGQNMGQWRAISGISTAPSAALMASTFFSRGKVLNSDGKTIKGSVHTIRIAGQVRKVEVYVNAAEAMQPVQDVFRAVSAVQNFAMHGLDGTTMDVFAWLLSMDTVERGRLLTLAGLNETQQAALLTLAAATRDWYGVYTGKVWPEDPTAAKVTTKEARADASPINVADDLTAIMAAFTA